MTAAQDRIPQIIAGEIQAKPQQVMAAMALLDEGSTVPFIARYRKEVTGGLDDIQLRALEERLGYLRELEARRKTVLDSIASQGKLTDELSGKIASVETKAELEDIYLPFKPKRRTRAQIARERGLQPLADAILADRKLNPAEIAAAYLGDEVPDAKAALDGARDILTETFAENADLVGKLRTHMKGALHAARQGDAAARKRKAPNSPTISTTSSIGRTFPAIAPSPCCAAAMRRCCRSISRSTPTTHPPSSRWSG